MASLKCLACGHDNRVGDESCASCSSSLNLRLCSACEAINANGAQRCHSCGAQFSPEAEVVSPVEELGHEAPANEKVLPAAWMVGAEQATQRGRRITAALWLMPLLAATAGAMYYLYGAPQAAALGAPRIAEVNLPPVTPADAAPVLDRTASAPAAQPKTVIEPKRAPAPVTHTRAASVATPVKAAPAAVPGVSEPAPHVVGYRGRVTHTRAEPGQAAEASAAPALAGASVPSTAAKAEPAPCAPEVAALGLCKGN